MLRNIKQEFWGQRRYCIQRYPKFWWTQRKWINWDSFISVPFKRCGQWVLTGKGQKISNGSVIFKENQTGNSKQWKVSNVKCSTKTMSVFPFRCICLDMKRVKSIYCLFLSGKGNISPKSWASAAGICLRRAEARQAADWMSLCMETQQWQSSPRWSPLHSWAEGTAQVTTYDTWRIHREAFA